MSSTGNKVSEGRILVGNFLNDDSFSFSMEIVNKEEFLAQKRFIIRKLMEAIFIYPTDTIYGIGCNAENKDLVTRLRMLKKRFGMPFSVIPPSKKWVEENCDVDKKAAFWIGKLPGPYTLIMNLKNKKAVANNVNLDGKTLGVRIPNNWFSKIVTEMGVPVVTTSANVSGHNFLTCLDDLDPNLKKGVDIFIEEGVIEGRPSTLIMLDGSKIEITER